MTNVKKQPKKTPRPKQTSTRQKRTTKSHPTTDHVQPTTEPADVPTPAIRHKLPSGWQQLKTTLRFLYEHRRFVVAYTLIYAILNLMLVHNFASDVAGLKSQLSTLLGGNPTLTGLSTYALLVTTTSNATGAGAAYQYVLLILFSLVFIWALRQFMADLPSEQKVTLKSSFYNSMYPLVPFVLVLLVLTLELLPLVAGGSLFGIVIANGIAITILEKVLWGAIFLILAAVTVWLVSMTLFSMYIVTLPGGMPVQALRDSRRITAGRRLNLVRKLLFLAVSIVLIGAVVLIPVIMVAAPLTAVFLFVLGALALPFVHTYLYGLYRELLV